MSVNLKKGQKVSLSKGNAGLSKILVGLGWDAIEQKGGFFSSLLLSQHDIDCDASAFLLQNGKLVGTDDIVYYGNLKHSSGTVNHLGDNLTGVGDGDDECIVVELDKIPSKYDRIVFVVNIYEAYSRKQNFGMIQNAFIRIVDSKTNTELCKYDLTEDYSGMTAMIFGEVYRRDGEWKFGAIGEGTKDANIRELSKKYL